MGENAQPRRQAIALIEQALQIIDDHGLDGIAAAHVSNGLAFLKAEAQAAAVLDIRPYEAQD